MDVVLRILNAICNFVNNVFGIRYMAINKLSPRHICAQTHNNHYLYVSTCTGRVDSSIIANIFFFCIVIYNSADRLCYC